MVAWLKPGFAGEILYKVLVSLQIELCPRGDVVPTGRYLLGGGNLIRVYGRVVEGQTTVYGQCWVVTRLAIVKPSAAVGPCDVGCPRGVVHHKTIVNLGVAVMSLSNNRVAFACGDVRSVGARLSRAVRAFR